jgi:hypothetical protein
MPPAQESLGNQKAWPSTNVDTRSNHRVMRDSGFDSNYEMMLAHGLNMHNLDYHAEFSQMIEGFRYRDAEEEAAARAAMPNTRATAAAGNGQNLARRGAPHSLWGGSRGRWAAEVDDYRSNAPGGGQVGSSTAPSRGGLSLPTYETSGYMEEGLPFRSSNYRFEASDAGASRAVQGYDQRGIANSHGPHLGYRQYNAGGEGRAYRDDGRQATNGHDDGFDGDYDTCGYYEVVSDERGYDDGSHEVGGRDAGANDTTGYDDGDHDGVHGGSGDGGYHDYGYDCGYDHDDGDGDEGGYDDGDDDEGGYDDGDDDDYGYY